MQGYFEETKKADTEDGVEENVITEYMLVKYIVMIIPIYLSFVFFIFLDGSLLGLLKTIAGYTAVFSLFLLTDEKIYFILKKNISQFMKKSSLFLIVLFSCAGVLYISDAIFIKSMENFSIFFGGITKTIVHILNKFLWSSFLLFLTFYINVCILFILLKLKIADIIISKFR